MGGLAQVGQYCPNENCSKYQAVEAGNIIRYGTSRQGRQRYQCKVCRQTFNEHVNTVFYGCRTAEKDIVEGLQMLAEGMGIRAVARVKGVKPDTVAGWLRRAGAHAERLEQVLLDRYPLQASQIDALYSYVQRKGKKKPTTGEAIAGTAP